MQSGRDIGDKAATPNDPNGENKEVGDALRSAYRRTVEEQVPDEMLDLLRKLG